MSIGIPAEKIKIESLQHSTSGKNGNTSGSTGETQDRPKKVAKSPNKYKKYGATIRKPILSTISRSGSKIDNSAGTGNNLGIYSRCSFLQKTQQPSRAVDAQQTAELDTQRNTAETGFLNHSKMAYNNLDDEFQELIEGIERTYMSRSPWNLVCHTTIVSQVPLK